MTASSRGCTRMRFVDDDERWTHAQKVRAARITLDVIEADDGVRIREKYAIARRKVSFETARSGSRHGHRANMETRLQLSDPLIDQMRRAKHGHSVNFAAIEHFTGNQCRFDGFTDTDIVGYEQS